MISGVIIVTVQTSPAAAPSPNGRGKWVRVRRYGVAIRVACAGLLA